MELNTIKQVGTWGETASDLNTNFGKINTAIESIRGATTRNKGYYLTAEALNEAFPTSSIGSIAYVGSVYPYAIYRWDGSAWVNSGKTGGREEVNLNNYATTDDVRDILASLFVPVESEEALRSMLESGEYDPTLIYYVVEE